LSESVLMVFQSMCAFFLCDQSPVIFSVQMFCLCSAMRALISVLMVDSCGSLWFVLRMSLRCWILSLMC